MASPPSKLGSADAAETSSASRSAREEEEEEERSMLKLFESNSS